MTHFSSSAAQIKIKNAGGRRKAQQKWRWTDFFSKGKIKESLPALFPQKYEIINM